METPVRPNSYMLPHGTRSAASARVTTPATSRPVATIVRAMPIRLSTALRGGTSSSSGGATATDPEAPAPTVAATGCTASWRTNSSSARWARNASASTTVPEATA